MASPIIVGTPGTYQPVSSEIWFIYNDGSLTSSPDFKYVFIPAEIDPVTAALTFLGLYKIPPRPINGWGAFSPSKLLRSYMSYDLQPDIINMTAARNSIIYYGYFIGFTYNPGYIFYDTQDNGSGNAQLIFDTTSSTPDIQIGDLITISMDNQSVNPYMNAQNVNVSNVTFSGSDMLVDTNLPFTPSTTIQSGTITQLFRLNDTSGLYYAYNGTRQYNQKDYMYFDNKFVIRTNSDFNSFLTNYKYIDVLYFTDPNFLSLGFGKSIFVDQYETVSMLYDYNNYSNFSYNVVLFDDTATAIGGNSDTLDNIIIGGSMSSDAYYNRFDLPSGPQNFIDMGWFPDFNGVSSYLVFITDDVTPSLKTLKQYDIIDNCSKYPDNFRIAFLNKHGAFDYWNFNWKSTNVQQVNRNEYRKVPGPDKLVQTFSYDEILSVKENNTWTISTDWISEFDSNFLKELLSSTKVFLLDYTGFISGEKVINVYDKYPIIITDTSHQVKTYIDDKLFCMTLNFKMAFDENNYNQ